LPAKKEPRLDPVLPATTQKVEWSPPAATGGVPALPAPIYAVEEDAAIYAGDAAYPGVLAEVTSDGVMRQQRVVGWGRLLRKYLQCRAAQFSTFQRLEKRILIELDLGVGVGRGEAWGCDLSYEYVKINASYTT
jgi:hypothetical protein